MTGGVSKTAKDCQGISAPLVHSIREDFLPSPAVGPLGHAFDFSASLAGLSRHSFGRVPTAV